MKKTLPLDLSHNESRRDGERLSEEMKAILETETFSILREREKNKTKR